MGVVVGLVLALVGYVAWRRGQKKRENLLAYGTLGENNTNTLKAGQTA